MVVTGQGEPRYCDTPFACTAFQWGFCMARAIQSVEVVACGGVLLLATLALSFGASVYQLEELIVGWLLFSAGFVLLSALMFAGTAGFLLITRATKWAVQYVHALLEAASTPTIHPKGLH